MRNIAIDLTPEEYHVPDLMKEAVARHLHVAASELEPLHVTHRTLDCRKHNIVYHTNIVIGDTLDTASPTPSIVELPATAPRVVVVGAGSAGLFAALRLIEHGVRPIIVERGKPVEERKYDIARLTREGVVNPDSNWCFGEGGAGTYSDGKLYTRSTKRGDVGAVLRTFVAHGADPDIMLDAHAHIGTDRLSGIIANMRNTIEHSGGEYHFNTRVEDLIVKDGQAKGVVDGRDERIEGDAVILATGHSARDIYHLFHRHGWMLEAKPFALGVRVEHPQELINEIQYHGRGYSKYLPPASYSLTTQAEGHGVFSFCMCPGGVIVPAATANSQQVVNGMSNSRRNSPYANSGIAVSVSPSDVADDDALALLRFQQEVEQQMFRAAGNTIDAPTQKLTDFLRRQETGTIRPNGYMGKCVAARLDELLPRFVTDSLREGLQDFGRKMRGFVCEDALLMGVESRTSSPVRITRDRTSLQHPQIAGLFPCGEGAGYAGGIVSSAVDGMRCADGAVSCLQKRL